MAAMFDSGEEAEAYLEDLTKDLIETDGAGVEGWEQTTYSKIKTDGQMAEIVEVQVFLPGTPTDDEIIAAVVEETPGYTEILGAVQDETTKRIITIDKTDGIEPEDDDVVTDVIDRPEGLGLTDADELPD